MQVWPHACFGRWAHARARARSCPDFYNPWSSCKTQLALSPVQFGSPCYAPGGGTLSGAFVVFSSYEGAYCSGHGACYNNACVCDVGFAGTWCEVRVDPACGTLATSSCIYYAAQSRSTELLARCRMRLVLLKLKGVSPDEAPEACAAAGGRIANHTTHAFEKAEPNATFRNSLGRRAPDGIATAVVCVLPSCYVKDEAGVAPPDPAAVLGVA